MAETTLNTQLSGAEIIEAVIDRLREKMRRDCYLNQNSAYDWFSAHVTVALNMHDTGTLVKADYAVEAGAGVIPDLQTALESGETDLEIAAAPPNVVRVETGQAVPVKARDERGRDVVKGVHFKRTDTAKVLAKR